MPTRRRLLLALLALPLLGGAAMLWRNLAYYWQPRFDEHVAGTLQTVTDLLFPGDGLPGAAALGVHDRIIAMSDLHPLMAAGVGWLDDWAVRKGVANFLALDEGSRHGAIEAAFALNDGVVKDFLATLRFHAGLIYYSEPLIKSAFAYTGPPQPDGFPDFADPPQ